MAKLLKNPKPWDWNNDMLLNHTFSRIGIAASLCCSMCLASMVLRAEDQPADDPKPEATKVDAKAAADPESKAKQAVETLEALGKVVDVFEAALGGRAINVEAAEVVEAAVAGQVFVDVQAGEALPAGGDPFEQQFRQQFGPLAKTELNFVRAVCQPNAEQSKKIKAAGDIGLKTAVKKFAEVQKKMQQGMRAGKQPQWPDPRKLMSEVLLKTVKETMSADQAKRYEAELAKRDAARKRAALLNLVAKLDKDLVLTADQRGKLSEALSSNWKDEWCQQLEVFMYGDTYMPLLPDAHVLPVLTEKQKQIWSSIPKQHNQIWGWAGFGFVQGVDIDLGEVVEQAVEAKVEIKVEVKQAEEKKEE